MDEIGPESNIRKGDGASDNNVEATQPAEFGITARDNEIVTGNRSTASLVDANKGAGSGSPSYIERLLGQGVVQTGLEGTRTRGQLRTGEYKTAELGQDYEASGKDQVDKKTAQFLRDGNDSERQAAPESKAKELPKGFKPVDPKERTPGIESYEDEKTGLRVDVKNASPEFRNKILTEIGNLPEQDRQRLKDANGKIAIVGTNADYFGAAANDTPRGWAAGSTWNNASGAYDRENSTVVIAERKIDSLTGKFIENPNPLAVLKHEYGHAIDQSLETFHNSKEFIEAYNKDIAKLTPEQRKDFHYQLQKSFDGKIHAGREETFADVFAALRGHGVLRKNPGGNSSEEILKAFPETAKVLEARLKRK